MVHPPQVALVSVATRCETSRMNAEVAENRRNRKARAPGRVAREPENDHHQVHDFECEHKVSQPRVHAEQAEHKKNRDSNEARELTGGKARLVGAARGRNRTIKCTDERNAVNYSICDWEGRAKSEERTGEGNGVPRRRVHLGSGEERQLHEMADNRSAAGRRRVCEKSAERCGGTAVKTKSAGI
jgi:hypothetical protein